jgi:hypothetical protein
MLIHCSIKAIHIFDRAIALVTVRDVETKIVNNMTIYPTLHFIPQRRWLVVIISIHLNSRC